MLFSTRLILLSLFFLLPAATFAQASSPASAHFGRFGRFNDDGLLTLNVSPHGFAAPPTNTPLQVTFGQGKAQAIVTAIDTTGKVLRLANGGPDEPTQLRYTLLYPGLSATYGRQMHLRFSDAQGKPVPVVLTELPLSRQSGFCAGLVLRRQDRSSMPLLIAFRPGFQPAVKTQYGLLLDQGEFRMEAQEAIGEVRFVTPLGLRELPPNLSASQSEELQRECCRWASIPLPVRERSESHFSPDGQSVTFTETFRTKENGLNIAPLPPILAFARAHGYPVSLKEELVSTACRTKWGDIAYARGNILRYTLPVPPTEERGYVRMETAGAGNERANVGLLNELVGHLGGNWASNGVDLGYAGMANAQMAWAYLNPVRRKELQAAWKRYLPLAFALPPVAPPTHSLKNQRPNSQNAAVGDAMNTPVPKPPAWKLETEPFTRQAYLWTYFIAGPNHRRYDLDWGDALPLYGLYKYAQYTGDWELVRAHWNDVGRIYRYFDLGDDWAWMTVVNADHGYSTGTGDPLAATLCGTIACLKMARALGDKTSERHFAAQSARIAVPAVARFWYTAWARKAGLIGPKSVVLGFHEMEGFTRARLGEDDPWDTTSALSGDGVLPELYDALQAFGGNALADYEAEYARSFPDWYQGDVTYPFATTYKGNSIYVTFPHIFARALLGEPMPALWNYVAAAQGNRNNGWIGPNVVAELLSRQSPLMLTEWQPAAYLDGSVSPDGRQTLLLFHLDRPMVWTLKFRAQNGRLPLAITQNGKRLPFENHAGHLTLRLWAQGNVALKILFAAPPPQ